MERLTNECLHGLLHYQCWRLLNDQFRAEPELAEAGSFFLQATANAHIDTATLRLHRLIDRTRKAISAYSLLDFAEKHRATFEHGTEEQVQEAIRRGHALLAEAERTLDHFRQQRNNYFVHISKEYFSQPHRSVVEDYPVTYRDVYDTLSHVGTLLNLFRGLYDGSEMLYEVIGVEDSFRSLTFYLRTGKRYEQEERLRQLRAL